MAEKPDVSLAHFKTLTMLDFFNALNVGILLFCFFVILFHKTQMVCLDLWQKSLFWNCQFNKTKPVLYLIEPQTVAFAE